MKRILSSIIATCLFLSAFSQIPNPGFESWTSTGFPSYQNPNGWGNLNGATAITGTLTCERASGGDVHSGSYAIKLTSKSVFGQSAPGIAVTGTINTSTQELLGGFPYTQRPTHLKGWYKFSPVTGDNGEVRVTLWRRSPAYELVGEGVILPNSSIPNYTMFLVPITYSSANAPDSGRILLISTNTNNIQIGSQLIVDDLEFVDCSSLSVSLSATDVTTAGNADGTATATPSGGTPPYNYYWSPSAQTTSTIVNLAPGTYCVTISDANGCTATTACETVSEPDCSGFSVSVTTTDNTTVGGTGGTATANPSGGTSPYQYSWSNGDTSYLIVNLPAGIYCVTATDSVGCTAAACDTVFDPSCAGFDVSVAATDATFLGATDGTAAATISGGSAPYDYQWNEGSTDSSITNLGVGIYCVTVTDVIGCSDTACGTVSSPACSGFAVSLTGTDVTTVNGSDGTAIAAPSGGTPPYSYAWDDGQITDTAVGLQAGQHCVTVSDNAGCQQSGCMTLNEPDCSAFTVSVSGSDPSVVGGNDGSASAMLSSGNAPFTYSWSPGGETDSAISNLSAGTYCVTVEDAAGCIANDCVALNDPSCAGFSVSATGADPTMVGGIDGTASAAASGGTAPHSYSWSNGDTSQNLTGLSEGTYCVTAADAAGCTADTCITLSDPDCSGFSVAVTATDESAAGAGDGTASAGATGGAAPVQYLWSNGAATQNINSLAPDNYCVTATDDAGCTAAACDSVNAGTVGISDLGSAGINLFPNPAKDAVTIELKEVANYRFRLFDMKGKMVAEKILSAKSSVITLADFPSGNYLVEMKNLESGKLFNGKLVMK